MDLMGKVAMVTGGGVRLGKALAVTLAQHGVRVAIHYNSSAAPAEATVEEIVALGRDAAAFQADLHYLAQMDVLFQRVTERFGPIDILINNAAIFEPGGVWDTSQANWDDHFAVNLRAPFFLSQSFARQLGQGCQGHIINIADWRATRPQNDYIAYTLTKAALIAMTQNLALALAPNIQVNAIAPGAILPPPGEDESYLARLAQRIPSRRYGSPADVTSAAVFLLESDFITGELIFLTGGQHLT